MANDKQKQSRGENQQEQQQSIGNQQRTTQTGAQNARGENIDQEEDPYTDDLRRSGNRTSSNRKNEDITGR